MGAEWRMAPGAKPLRIPDRTQTRARDFQPLFVAGTAKESGLKFLIV